MVISVSIGIVYAGDQYAIAHEMLKDAGIAMYRSKALGKSTAPGVRSGNA